MAVAPEPRPAGPALSVLVCTCRRNDWLRELVATIVDDAAGHAAIELVIVDNDPSGSARPVLEQLASLPVPLVAAHLGEQNVALARNLAVALARAPRLLFLDDDQLVPRGFFAGLERAWRRRPHWASGIRPRVVHAHERPSQRLTPPTESGAAPLHPVDRRGFATNGLLIERRALALLGPAPFDPAFGLTGGEDTEMFVRLARRGVRLAWWPELTVIERVPEARAGPVAQLRRAFRIGMTDTLIALEREGASWPRYALRALVNVTAGSVTGALAGAIRERPTLRPESWRVAMFAGQLFALCGGRWEPYRKGG